MLNENTRYYLGGPMSGYPEFNFPAFKAATIYLRDLGFRIFSAHEVDHGKHTGTGTQPWSDYMKGDIKMLLRCDAAIFLPGWASSKGAKVEFDISVDLGYPVYQYIGESQDMLLALMTKPMTLVTGGSKA